MRIRKGLLAAMTIAAWMVPACGEDHAIVRVWTYQNSLELQEQLGLFDVKAPGNIPAAPAAPPAKK